MSLLEVEGAQKEEIPPPPPRPACPSLPLINLAGQTLCFNRVQVTAVATCELNAGFSARYSTHHLDINVSKGTPGVSNWFIVEIECTIGGWVGERNICIDQ